MAFYFRGLVLEDSGPPTDATPTDAAFYVNTDDDTVWYLDLQRGTWTQVLDGATLPDQTLLTATI